MNVATSNSLTRSLLEGVIMPATVPGSPDKSLQWNNNGTFAGMAGSQVSYFGFGVLLPSVIAPSVSLTSGADLMPFTDGSLQGVFVREHGGNSPGPLLAGKYCTNTLASASTPGTVIAKMPVHDITGSLVGYLPVYDDIS